MADLNLGQLSNFSNAAVTLGNLILVTPQRTVGYQPQNQPTYAKDTETPPPALLFNYNGEESVTLQSDITDHYIENNSAIQDQITLKPETYTVQGFVGELNNVAPLGLKTAKILAEKLTAINGYAPQISATAALAYAEAAQAYKLATSVSNSAISTWASLTGSDAGGGGQGVINGSTTQSDLRGQANKTQTQQQIYFQQLYGYWKSRTLFTIQTPWAIFQDMAIMSLRAIQDDTTEFVTDFEITFKLMRFAETKFTLTVGKAINGNTFQGRGSASAAGITNLGTNTLQTSPVSFIGSVA